jgi:ribonuclease BN (tRNA processing enzyme)
MRITVLGGCGAWPEEGQACSGFLVEHDGFRLLVDAGYAIVPRLQRHAPVESIDAVLVSHGHPDHCADVNPLLRARVFRDEPAPDLPLYAPPGALDAVLALDHPRLLRSAYTVHEFTPGAELHIGPFAVGTRLLPHSVPNAGVRLRAGGAVVAYTGDTGPSPAVAELADGADVLIADATYIDEAPEHLRGVLSSARLAGREAQRAGVGQLLLTHLFPGTDPDSAVSAASTAYGGDIAVARADLVIDLT